MVVVVFEEAVWLKFKLSYMDLKLTNVVNDVAIAFLNDAHRICKSREPLANIRCILQSMFAFLNFEKFNFAVSNFLDFYLSTSFSTSTSIGTHLPLSCRFSLGFNMEGGLMP